MSLSPFRLTSKGIEVYIKITPNAAMDSIEGLRRRSFDDGGQGEEEKPLPSSSSSKKGNASKGEKPAPAATAELEVRVTAPPDKGKANTSLLKLLSKEWKIPSSDLSVATGMTSRKKKLLVTPSSSPASSGGGGAAGDSQRILEHLLNWLESQRFEPK